MGGFFDKCSDKIRRMPKAAPWLRMLLYVATALFAVLSIVESGCGYFPYVIDIAIYVVSACSLTVSAVYLYCDLKTGVGTAVRGVTGKSRLARRAYGDYRFRAVLATSFSFLLNLAYAVGNGIYAWFHHSPWLGTLAAYYICLSVMRFTVVWQERKDAKSRESSHISDRERGEQQLWEGQVCKRGGGGLIAMAVVLCGAVVLLIREEGGKHYAGFLIFAVAAYTFYKIILAVINLIKVRRMKSPLLLAIRNIGYADALVAVLSLQTAMFAAFGEGEEQNTQWMNGMTGVAVCLMILAIGIYMIRKEGSEKKKLIEDKLI